jgi:hypothetical protein
MRDRLASQLFYLIRSQLYLTRSYAVRQLYLIPSQFYLIRGYAVCDRLLSAPPSRTLAQGLIH